MERCDGMLCGSAIKVLNLWRPDEASAGSNQASLLQFILPACLQNPPTFVQMNPASNPDYFSRAVLFCSCFFTSVSPLNSTFEGINNPLDLIRHCCDLCRGHLPMVTHWCWCLDTETHNISSDLLFVLTEMLIIKVDVCSQV